MHGSWWLRRTASTIGAGVPSQSILAPRDLACTFFRHAFWRNLVSRGHRTHAFSLSVLSRAPLREPQEDSAGKPGRLHCADGDPRMAGAWAQYRAHLDSGLT